MSTVSALAHLEAMQATAAVPLTEFRHRHLSDRPLVIVPLALAGETGTLLAAMVGTAKRLPTLLVVGQPRDRVQQLTFAADFGRIVMDYVNSCRVNRREITSRKGETRHRYTTAPQILVPNRGGIAAITNLGRAYRFRRAPEGQPPIDPVIPELGMWLTFLAERAEQAGTSMLMAATDLLAEHWATGQSTLENQNLSSLMAWISPPPGQTVAQALVDAEKPALCPPAGPATAPEFDNLHLAPAIKALDAARAVGNDHATRAAQTELRELIQTQIAPTWRMMWSAISLLRGVPEAPRATARFETDCASFTSYSDYQDKGGALPQPKRDKAIAAARRLSDLERAVADLETDMAFDDPFVLADRRSSGEAFAGVVEEADPDRVVTSDKIRPVLRPLVTVRTIDPTRLAEGTKLVSPSMPKGHKAVIVSSRPDGDETLVTLEINGGMGSGRKPKPGSVPTRDQTIAYLPDPGWRQRPEFPHAERNPWTHTTPEPEAAATDVTTIQEWDDDI